LLDVLLRVAEELDERSDEQNDLDRNLTAGRVRALVEQFPPLPTFSRFHPAFVDDPRGDTPEGDMRSAFFQSYDEESCEHLRLDGSVSRAMTGGRTVVSAAFVTPYPPGFPVLVPGQVVTEDILNYLKAVDVKEIHGYQATHGLRVFRQEVLDRLQEQRERARSTPAASPSLERSVR
jgi:arginine decarboxylase